MRLAHTSEPQLAPGAEAVAAPWAAAGAAAAALGPLFAPLPSIPSVEVMPSPVAAPAASGLSPAAGWPGKMSRSLSFRRLVSAMLFPSSARPCSRARSSFFC